MKITDVKVATFEWPLPRPLANGKIVHTKTGFNLVTVETDAGVSGIGQTYTKPVIKRAIEQFRELVIGEDPNNIDRIWELLWNPKRVGRRGLTTQALSAIDIALWDLRGKLAGLPVHQLLGGFHERIPAYVAGGYYAEGKGIKELQEEMHCYGEMGARAVKIKVGLLSIREDAQRVKAAREALGWDIDLMIDANCAYRAHDAIRLARRIEEHDIFWFEEPVGADDYDGYRRLVEATSIPIAGGENEYTRYGFRDLIHTGTPILQPDAKICGGISECNRIAALAQTYDRALAPHGAQEVHIHLAAGYPCSTILEYYPTEFDPMAGKRVMHQLHLEADGTVRPPMEPGMATEPNYEALAPFRVA